MNENESVRVSTINGLLIQTSTFGNYIDHIDFKGMNDSLSQYIKKIDIPNEDNFTPEWLNLAADSVNSLIVFN